MTIYKGYRIHAPAEGHGMICAEPEWNASEARREWFSTEAQARQWVDDGAGQWTNGQEELF